MRTNTVLSRLLNTTNCHIFIDVYQEDPSLNFWIIVTFATLYASLFVLGLVGNFSVIYCTARNAKLQSVQNFFILNLAISDLAICLFSLPVTPITNVLKNWLFGAQMCHAVPWIQGVSIFIATFSLAAIALDRYYMIMTPHSPVRKKIARPLMLMLWVLACVFTLPYALFMKYVKEDYFCGYFCTEEWPNDNVQKFYTVFVLCTQYIIPFTVMFVCYYKIFEKLQTRTQERIRKYNERSLVLFASAGIMSAVGHSIQGKDIMEQISRKASLIQRTRRNTFLLVSMVFVFGFCWLPQHIVSMIIDTQGGYVFDRYGRNWNYVISLGTHCLAMVSIVANPVLYGLLNPEFVSILKKTCSDWKLNLRKVSSRRFLEWQSSNSTFI